MPGCSVSSLPSAGSGAGRIGLRAGCHLVKATGKGCFMGREKGQEVMLPSLAPQGWRATIERALPGQGTRGTGQGQRQLGLQPLTMGWGPTDLGAGAHLPRVPSHSPLCNPRLSQQLRPFLPSWGGGETFSLETLDTNFGFLARKISLVWKGGGLSERGKERAGGRANFAD